MPGATDNEGDIGPGGDNDGDMADITGGRDEGVGGAQSMIILLS